MSSSPSFSCNLDPNNQAHEDLVLNHFGIVRGRGPTFRPDPYAYYGPRYHTKQHFETYEMYTDLRKLRDEIPYDLVRPQVHYPDTYARSLKDVLIIILAHYPLHSNRRRPMEVNTAGDFKEPSLRAIADVWIAVLERNGVHRDSAKCMIYSSILVFDVLPISGNSKFGGKDGKNPHSEIYNYLFKASRALVKAIFDRLVGECSSALGIFAVGKAAFEACPALIEGLTIKLLNDRVCHPCLIDDGNCRVVSADAWIDQSLKVLKLVTGVELSINDDDRNDVCFVTPCNRIRHANSVAKKAAAAELKRPNDEKRKLSKSVQAEEVKAWRKRIRLAPNNDLSNIINSDATTPRSTSPVKKAPVRIKLSLRKPIVATDDESDSDDDESDSDNDESDSDDDESDSDDDESDSD